MFSTIPMNPHPWQAPILIYNKFLWFTNLWRHRCYTHPPFSHKMIFLLFLVVPVFCSCHVEHPSIPAVPLINGAVLPCSLMLLCFSVYLVFSSVQKHICMYVDICVFVKKWRSLCALYWKASRNMSTTLMMMSSIMMRNTTTFWVSGGRLQRSMALKNPILCLLHLPEPLPRAISPLASSSSSSSALLPLPLRLSLSAEPPHHTTSPRPLPWLFLLLSTSAALFLRSAPTVTSSASPATLPMPSVAPACQWRLGANLCQRVCESARLQYNLYITCWAFPRAP